ncbi:putative O-glycosylation ligase, exosortase A system-associated [soil metagenome]
MRDILILTIVMAAAIGALRHPWIGVILWTWLSIMNPHRYTYGIAYGAPVAQIALLSTVLGMFFSKDKLSSPFKGAPVVWLGLFMAWMTLSWLFGIDPEGDYDQWSKVMKIDLAIMIGLIVLHDKKHLIALTWVTAGSLAILGAKGGLFTLLGGGAERVWGPPGSFIEDNNEFGLSLVMTIPLLRFLQLQLTGFWGRQAMTVTMLLCAASALGSQSRGAFLAISAMTLLLWWRGKNRVAGAVLILLPAIALVAFMPESWVERMNTMNTYQEDGSARGRLGAWSNAWNLAFDYPLGVGFDAARQDLFDKYSSMPEVGARAAHSIYFQVLGNHGFIGLGLFLMIWLTTWFNAGWLRKRGNDFPQTKWCADLGSMIQVSLLGYFVGGAFLSLSYFDLPYDIMTLAVLARVWVLTRGWEREPVYLPSWKTIPGLATSSKAG